MSDVSTVGRRSTAPEVFVLPELRHARRREIGILILPDGNRRFDPTEGGYERGAHKVIEVAEHLARRPDVATLVACVLSPENVAARSDTFFTNVRRGFERLAESMVARGTLIDAGIRTRLCGDLAPLRARGSAGAALADAIELVVGLSERVRQPALTLYFGVGYKGTTPRDLDVDVVLRTGVESVEAMRLSGLCSHPSIANCGLTTLWPEVGTADVDAVIEATKARPKPTFSMGYGPSAAVAIARSIEATRPGVHASLPSHATASALRDAFEAPDAPGHTLTIEIVSAEGGTPVRLGATDGPHLLRVLAGGAWPPVANGDDFGAVLAPGQRGSMLVLPEWHYGYATIHPCEATPAGIAEGLHAAGRFARTHVALRGAERGGPPTPAAASSGGALR